MELTVDVIAGTERLGPGRRLVLTHVQDPRYPGLRAVFKYEVIYVAPHAAEDPYGPLDTDMLLGARMHGIGIEWAADAAEVVDRPHLSVSYMRDLPMSTWEVASRERLGAVLTSPAGKAVLRNLPAAPTVIEIDLLAPDLDTVDEIAAMVVDDLYPGIDQSTPAGRRRFQSLFKQARAAVLYQHLIGTGRTDPAVEIAKAYNVTPGAARTWIHRARQSGFLGRALTNMVGQATPHLPGLTSDGRGHVEQKENQ